MTLASLIAKARTKKQTDLQADSDRYFAILRRWQAPKGGDPERLLELAERIGRADKVDADIATLAEIEELDEAAAQMPKLRQAQNELGEQIQAATTRLEKYTKDIESKIAEMRGTLSVTSGQIREARQAARDLDSLRRGRPELFEDTDA